MADQNISLQVEWREKPLPTAGTIGKYGEVVSSLEEAQNLSEKR